MVTSYITISWNAAPGSISGYNVYRGSALGNESSTPLNNSLIVGLTYTDTTVYPGVSYSYAVYSVLNGVESATPTQVQSPPVPFPPTPPPLTLGSSLSFGVLAATTVTNVPASDTIVAGDVGVFPGTAITGFSAPAVISGVFHPGDYVSQGAQAAALASYTAGQALVGGTPISADIGGQTFVPGVYTASSSLAITGVLTLNAQGNTNGVFIFQIPSTLITAVSNSTVVLNAGAQASNIFWLVGSSATLNANTNFAGVIIAHTSITLGANVNVNGKLTALNGAVALNANDIVSITTGSLELYAHDTPYTAGTLIFDPITGTFQQVYIAGTTGATTPSFNATPGGMTVDGTITWMTLMITDVTVNLPTPPSIPNQPPAPPAPPTDVIIDADV